jgi:hypothetical protein
MLGLRISVMLALSVVSISDTLQPTNAVQNKKHITTQNALLFILRLFIVIVIHLKPFHFIFRHGFSQIFNAAVFFIQHNSSASLFQGHTLDKDHMAKELGDCLWYLAVAAKGIGYDLDTIAEMNKAKLRNRYPNGFESERSLHRDSKDI